MPAVTGVKSSLPWVVACTFWRRRVTIAGKLAMKENIWRGPRDNNTKTAVFISIGPDNFNEIAGMQTSSRPYLLKYGVPCHLDVIVPQSCAKLHYGIFLFIVSFLASSSHKMLIKEVAVWVGALYGRISPNKSKGRIHTYIPVPGSWWFA